MEKGAIAPGCLSLDELGVAIAELTPVLEHAVLDWQCREAGLDSQDHHLMLEVVECKLEEVVHALVPCLVVESVYTFLGLAHPLLERVADRDGQ